MRYALIAILLGAALALADDDVEPQADAADVHQHEAPRAPAPVDEAR